jgi:pimeloyl-ACP methyl ester carboxylesterase
MNSTLAWLAAVLSAAAVLLAIRGQSYSRVDAGGPVLRMFTSGSGSPTVVFEAGAGGSLDEWMRIQTEVGKFATALAYDRAGNGLSPKGPIPRDGKRIAEELHTALRRAHAVPPFILVGHSLGGPYIRIFAGMYPDEVAGLVLVDPSQEGLAAWAKARDPKPEDHKLRREDEVDCAPVTFAQASKSRMPTNIPIILITGMGPRDIPDFLPEALKTEVRKDREVFYPAKLKFHKEWVEQFPRGRQIVTENSGHGIPLEEPQLIIDTVRDVVERVRQRRESSNHE